MRNTSGNCAWCALETIARHQGISELHGVARGKGGVTYGVLGRFLQQRGMRYSESYRRAESLQIMREALKADKPVLFGIPGHALVCCGATTNERTGEEFVWVIDNTGQEGLQIKGWPTWEWMARWNGWIVALHECDRPLRPFQPNPGRTPPHIDPPLPNKPPDKVVVNPSPQCDLTSVNAKIDAILADLKATKDVLSKTVDTVAQIPAGKDGKPGATGPAGPAGPVGKPGRDGRDGVDGKPGRDGLNGKDGADGVGADPALIASLMARLKKLEDRRLTAELYDVDGNKISTVPFDRVDVSPGVVLDNVPLRIRLVPVQPPK